MIAIYDGTAWNVLLAAPVLEEAITRVMDEMDALKERVSALEARDVS